MMEWKPIETAPDGFFMLVACLDDDGSWFHEVAAFDGIFFTSSSAVVNPTHWMPLPPAPST